MADAPSRSTSRRRTLPGAISLVSALTTGTSSSVWKPGCSVMRRPLISRSVLPVPRSRRLIEPTSPRALFCVVAFCSLKATVPACGMERKSSSPEAAPVFSIAVSSSTVTGRTSLIWAPLICVPVTTIWLESSASSGEAGAASDCAYAVPCISARKAVEVTKERNFDSFWDMTHPCKSNPHQCLSRRISSATKNGRSP